MTTHLGVTSTAINLTGVDAREPSSANGSIMPFDALITLYVCVCAGFNIASHLKPMPVGHPQLRLAPLRLSGPSAYLDVRRQLTAFPRAATARFGDVGAYRAVSSFSDVLIHPNHIGHILLADNTRTSSASSPFGAGVPTIDRHRCGQQRATAATRSPKTGWPKTRLPPMSTRRDDANTQSSRLLTFFTVIRRVHCGHSGLATGLVICREG